MTHAHLPALSAALLLWLVPGPATAEEATPESEEETKADAEPEAEAEAEADTDAAAEAEPVPADVVVPGPWVYNRNTVAVGANQAGLLGTTRLQIRGPMGRTPSIVFQNTYAGAGIHAAISPAFVSVGPRFDLAPIDVFDVGFEFSYLYTWRSSAGLLPYDTLSGTLGDNREAIKDTAVAASKIIAAVSPTIKIKGGPVIGLWNVTWAYMHHFKPDGVTSRFVYDARSDMLLEWQDLLVTNIAAILVEPFDGTGPNGGPGPKLRVGAIMRDRQTLLSRDLSTALGGAVTFKPGPKPGWPDVFVAVMGYLRDVDREFAHPNLQVQLTWVLEREIGAKKNGTKRVAEQIKTALR